MRKPEKLNLILKLSKNIENMHKLCYNIITKKRLGFLHNYHLQYFFEKNLKSPVYCTCIEL